MAPIHLLVTGAAGKVGQAFITRCLTDPRMAAVHIRALCHNRKLTPAPRLEVVSGDIQHRETAVRALQGITHVLHLATCKEVPELVMDVTVKGLFWLLEEFRTSPSAKQFILLGGDAAVGHFFYRHPGPLTETTPHQAYPGCYALSKVLEEVMLSQFTLQYGLNTCCLRAPWIMEKDDFRHTLSFGDDLFGGPDWKTMVAADVAAKCRAAGTIPLLLDADGQPLKRSFVHLDDLTRALLAALDNPVTRGKTYNIGMDAPVDYAALAAYLAATRGLGSIAIPSPFHSTWYDNSRARLDLDWRPEYDMQRMVDAAWRYVRANDDPRKIWYPG